MKHLISILGLFVILCSCTSNNQKEKQGLELVFSSELTAEEIEGGRMTAEILWKFGRVHEAQVSPDGRNILYGLRRYDSPTNKSNTDIYRIPVEGGEPIQITSFKGNEFNHRWHPSGTKIGFLSGEGGTVQIWEVTMDTGTPKQISNIKDGINGFEYSPTGDKIFYIKDVKLDETTSDLYPDLPLANVGIMNNLMYRHWNAWHDYAYSHIFIADYSDGNIQEGKDIMEGETFDSPMSPFFDQTEISWSPDGKFIAYTCKKLTGKEYTLSTNSDIYLYNLESGDTQNITEGMPGYDKYPVFSPDGKKIAFQSMETPGYESDKDRLFLYDLTTGEKEYLTENFDESVSSLKWDKEGNRIYFISGIKATFQMYKINVETKETEQITHGVHNYNSLSLAGEYLVGEKMSMSMATEIFSVNKINGEEKQLTFTNQHIYDHIEMGKVEERWIKTTDNKEMLVWIIYPPKFDPGKEYPALLYCQGGPQSAVSQFFSYRWNFQMMAAHDYVIVAPNRRGLPTFGTEWNDQISGDYGGQNMKDYLSAIDAMKKEPFIDEDRLGAVGASYGGFSVFWLAGNHEKRFKVFISHCGIYNLESMYGATDESFFVNYDLGGAYWEKENQTAQKSYATSPHKFVQNWDTPILIVTGANDFRIPYTESLQAFNAAQLQGIPSRLLFFPEETHFVLKPQNSILWQREFFSWLDKYLK
jgi:dipeptidyl aminopeptidase/acylaminoacyl peptidase